MNVSLAPCAPEKGSCVDRQQVQRLREQIARSVSSAHPAAIHEGADKDTAATASSAEQSIINSSSADGDSARAVGNSGTGALNPIKPYPRASGVSCAAAGSNTGPTGAAGEGAGQRAGTREAEWQLTSLSQKALSSGRTKSSSLVRATTSLRLAIGCDDCLLHLSAFNPICTESPSTKPASSRSLSIYWLFHMPVTDKLAHPVRSWSVNGNICNHVEGLISAPGRNGCTQAHC